MSSMVTDKSPLVVLQPVCIPHDRRRLYEILGADSRFWFLVLDDPAADAPCLSWSEAPSRCEFKIDTGLCCE